MIRQSPKEPYKGLKRTSMKRKPQIYNPVTKNSYPIQERILAKGKVEILWKSPRVSFLTETPPKKRKGLRVKIDKLDELFSRYIRLRDNYTCQRCGVKSQHVQCAHFHGRANKATRYDESNSTTLCFYCHQYFHGHPLEFVEWTKKRLGEREFDMLNARMRIITKPDKKAITIYLQQKIRELENIT